MSPTAHVQVSLEQTDAFTVDSNGQIVVRWVTGKTPWQGPANISSGAGLFPPNAPLAASQQFGAPKQTNVFGVTKNGKLAVAWVTGAAKWSGPAEIGNSNFEPGAPVAASKQFGIDDQTDLFAVNKNGDLTVSWVTGTGNWQGPHSLSQGGYPTKASVAVSQRFGKNITDVYAVNNDGALTVFSVEGKGQWSGQTALSQKGVFPPGAAVAAGQQFGLTQTDVFAIDKNGALTVTWNDGNRWQGPQPISERNQFPAGGALATSRQFDLDQTDVFAIDNQGQATVSWVTVGGPWSGPQPISDAGFAKPGARLAAYQQLGVKGQTDLFVQKDDGSLWVFWVTEKTPWQGPDKI